MPNLGPPTPVFKLVNGTFPAIVGNLITGLTVTVSVYKDNQLVSISNNSAPEIGTTGRYSWALSNLPQLQTAREQFHIIFDGGDGNVDHSNFIFETEGQLNSMPPLIPQSGYLRKLF